MGDCAETADQLQEETAEEETPTEPDPCVDPLKERKKRMRILRVIAK
jgi:hypothetical protein